MIKLSDRLQKIADFIEPGESIADIGTDHGFLPIALWERGRSPHVILSDINAGPLEKARANINKYFPEKQFDLRIGSGIQTLKPAEVEAIVIAGMGGLLIAEILGDDLPKSKSYRKLILQPRNAQDKLRLWLFENGFAIEEEVLVREGKYLCEIIMAVPAGFGRNAGPEEIRPDRCIRSDDIDFEISPILFAKKDPLLVEFIENKIRIERKVHAAIKAKAVRDKTEMLRKSEERMELLQKMRKRSGINECKDE
ncbi:MAG: class I SAM-dependent methyltransferase [Eubacteriales bacterium]|nr:class I SAM-dependent methyltransferase [Eubacteriales bacterium]